MKFDFAKLMKNIFTFKTIAIFVLFFIVYYNLFSPSTESLTPTFCESNDGECLDGCVKPTQISGNCDTTIFKDDETGLCYRKCPYFCPDPLKDCKWNKCCANCGTENIRVDCDDTGLSSEYISETGSTNDILYDIHFYKHRHNIDNYLCQPTMSGKHKVCGPLASNEWITWYDIQKLDKIIDNKETF